MGATPHAVLLPHDFLSAFLLFEVQPVIAKMILPWFGGSSAVWSTCMLFFQIVLLLGYVYAHWLNKLAPAPAGHDAYRAAGGQPGGAADHAERAGSAPAMSSPR